jgi:hypothetical protein
MENGMLKANHVTAKIESLRLDETTRYAHVMRYLVGNKDLKNGLVILTSQNPDSIEASKEDNERFLDDLKQTLRRHQYSFLGQKGYYEGFEVSFVVFDMSEDEAMMFCEKFKQTSIIHISRTEDTVEGDLLFQLIYRGKAQETETVTGNSGDFADPGTRSGKKIYEILDYYSEIGGKLRSMGAKRDSKNTSAGEPRRYKIPFYGQDH